MINRLLREPLLHFFVLGVALFALSGWLHDGRGNATNEIVVSRGQLTSLRAQFERVWQRAPTAEEMRGLVDTWVREEIYYREGVAMGLDRDDPVVRRRVGQKVQFIVDGAIPAPPTEAQLQAWLNTHSAEYRIEGEYSFEQVYFDPRRHGSGLQRELDDSRLRLERGQKVSGDSTMLPAAFDGAAPDVTGMFGAEFEKALQLLPVGSWSEPVESGFGLHLVMLRTRQPGRAATLTEAREAVERDWLHDRAQKSTDEFYERLRANYTVRIDGEANVPAQVAPDAAG